MPLKKRESCAEPRSFIGLNRKVLGAYANVRILRTHCVRIKRKHVRFVRTQPYTHCPYVCVLPYIRTCVLFLFYQAFKRICCQRNSLSRKKPIFACSGGRSGKVQSSGEGSGKGKVWSVAWEALK